MYSFWLVIKDLFWFVLGYNEFSNLPSGARVALPASPALTQLAAPGATAEMPVATLGASEAVVVSDLVETASVVDIPPPSNVLYAPVVMYVSERGGTALAISPLPEFDSVAMMLPYGTAVTVVGYRGRWASVLRAHHTGFVLKEHLHPDKAAVWPQLVPGSRYESADTITEKVRWLIGDEFNAGKLKLPLQAGEYVHLRLLADKREIAWGEARPRLPGSWQSQLRGVAGIHMGILPKTDAVMEWMTDTGEGRLAYVETVAPDNTLGLSLVGLTVAGQYQMCVMSVSEWRELRPTFIEVA